MYLLLNTEVSEPVSGLGINPRFEFQVLLGSTVQQPLFCQRYQTPADCDLVTCGNNSVSISFSDTRILVRFRRADATVFARPSHGETKLMHPPDNQILLLLRVNEGQPRLLRLLAVREYC